MGICHFNFLTSKNSALEDANLKLIFRLMKLNLSNKIYHAPVFTSYYKIEMVFLQKTVNLALYLLEVQQNPVRGCHFKASAGNMPTYNSKRPEACFDLNAISYFILSIFSVASFLSPSRLQPAAKVYLFLRLGHGIVSSLLAQFLVPSIVFLWTSP